MEKYQFSKYHNPMQHLSEGQRVRHIIPHKLYNCQEPDNRIWLGYYKNRKIYFNNESFYSLTDFAFYHYRFLYNPLLSYIWKNQDNSNWYDCEFEVVENDNSYWISTEYILEYHYEKKFSSIFQSLQKLEEEVQLLKQEKERMNKIIQTYENKI